MGNTETKKTENTGEVVNSIILNPIDINANKLEVLLITLNTVVILSFVYQVYKDYRRSLKKKYTSDVYTIRQ